MSNQLDQVSQVIGSLQSEVKNVKEDVKEIKEMVKGIHETLPAKVVLLEEKVDDMVPHIEFVKTIRIKAIGFALGVTAVAGILGTKSKAIWISVKSFFV